MLTTFPMNSFVRVTDPARARHFYEHVLGLTFDYDNEYVTVFRSGPTQVMAQHVKEFTPVPGTVLGWEVKGIEAVVDHLRNRGVTFERYQGMAQDDRGIWKSPAGKVAWFKDPDGNTLAISEH
jgi:catechol 2,3-dioxygenase-like lactoylglutathione lyase family enzyme